MRHWWWKVLCVLLLVYTAAVGLRTPLKPALVHALFTHGDEGTPYVVVTGYSTHFRDSYPDVQVWIETRTRRLCIDTIIPETQTTLVFLPGSSASNMDGSWTIAVRTERDGLMWLRDAFFVKARSSIADTVNCPPPALDHLDGGNGFPNRSILNETIRNLFFHVPMWFTMIVLMGISFFFSIKHLRTGNLGDDLAASIAVNVSLLFGILGITTGSIWARATWGGWWTYDTKLNGSALTLLMYFAYVILRGSVPDAHKRGRLAAVYNIFAFMLMLVFIMVLPRLTDSLHPGNGGNPAFSQYDLDSALKSVFYPACLGWILLGVWAFNLRLRHGRLTAMLDENEAH